MKYLSLLALALAACDVATKEDPLASYGPDVQNAIPPQEAQKPVTPAAPPVAAPRVGVPSNALSLALSPENTEFTEGKKGQVELIVSIKGFDYQIQIDVQNLPRGATYNSSRNLLEWTPAANQNQGEAVTHYPLAVQVSTLSNPILSISEKVVLHVKKR